MYICTSLDSAFKVALKSPMATIGYLSKFVSEESLDQSNKSQGTGSACKGIFHATR
jgi:hypothetical protein